MKTNFRNYIFGFAKALLGLVTLVWAGSVLAQERYELNAFNLEFDVVDTRLDTAPSVSAGGNAMFFTSADEQTTLLVRVDYRSSDPQAAFYSALGRVRSSGTPIVKQAVFDGEGHFVRAEGDEGSLIAAALSRTFEGRDVEVRVELEAEDRDSLAYLSVIEALVASLGEIGSNSPLAENDENASDKAASAEEEQTELFACRTRPEETGRIFEIRILRNQPSNVLDVTLEDNIEGLRLTASESMDRALSAVSSTQRKAIFGGSGITITLTDIASDADVDANLRQISLKRSGQTEIVQSCDPDRVRSEMFSEELNPFFGTVPDSPKDDPEEDADRLAKEDSETDPLLLNIGLTYVYRTANVRSGPDTSFQILSRVYRGDRVNVGGYEINDGGNRWARVRIAGELGFISQKVLTTALPPALPGDVLVNDLIYSECMLTDVSGDLVRGPADCEVVHQSFASAHGEGGARTMFNWRNGERSLAQGGEESYSVTDQGTRLSPGDFGALERDGCYRSRSSGASICSPALANVGLEDVDLGNTANKCVIIAASRKTLAEVRQFIFEIGGEMQVYQSKNGWYAITAGMVNKERAVDRIAAMVARGQLPDDAFCGNPDKLRGFVPKSLWQDA